MFSARVAQQEKLDVLMRQLDQALTQEINTPQLNASQPQNKYFWQRWIVIEPAKQPAVALMQRPLILKEVQLRLITCTASFATRSVCGIPKIASGND